MDKIKHNQYNNEWAKKNRDKVNLFQKNWRNKRYEWYRKLKEGKCCSMCGETHPACLDFHHKDPKEKLGLVYSLVKRFSSNNEVALKEVEKCVLICANCHRKHHYKG